MFGHLPGLPHINNEGFYDVVLEKRGGNCPPSPPLATPLIFIKMLDNVGMAVPKIIQTRCSTYAPRQWMIAYNNNNMCNPIIKDVGRGVTHVIIVVCYHPLPWCIRTAPCLYDFWHCHPYIVQHLLLYNVHVTLFIGQLHNI